MKVKGTKKFLAGEMVFGDDYQSIKENKFANDVIREKCVYKLLFGVI
jgi:hypothetical protein